MSNIDLQLNFNNSGLNQDNWSIEESSSKVYREHLDIQIPFNEHNGNMNEENIREEADYSEEEEEEEEEEVEYLIFTEEDINLVNWENPHEW